LRKQRRDVPGLFVLEHDERTARRVAREREQRQLRFAVRVEIGRADSELALHELRETRHAREGGALALAALRELHDLFDRKRLRRLGVNARPEREQAGDGRSEQPNRHLLALLNRFVTMLHPPTLVRQQAAGTGSAQQCRSNIDCGKPCSSRCSRGTVKT
jgi:hypothetical protein